MYRKGIFTPVRSNEYVPIYVGPVSEHHSIHTPLANGRGCIEDVLTSNISQYHAGCIGMYKKIRRMY
jgi:hypothetical protein